MKIDLEGKKFVSASNTENGEVNSETVFEYHQKGEVVWADYSGGEIILGHLIGRFENGKLSMKYHHLNQNNELMAGECISIPELLDDGRLKFTESWQWYTGDQSTGESEIVEVI